MTAASMTRHENRDGLRTASAGACDLMCRDSGSPVSFNSSGLQRVMEDVGKQAWIETIDPFSSTSVDVSVDAGHHHLAARVEATKLVRLGVVAEAGKLSAGESCEFHRKGH